LEKWNDGWMEDWNIGRLEWWNDGTMCYELIYIERKYFYLI